MALSFSPARINRGLIKKAAKQKGFMTSILNRMNTDRQNAREDARNKELDALKSRELDIREEANIVANQNLKLKTEKEQQTQKAAIATAQGLEDSGLKYYNVDGELETYYLPTLKQQLGTGKYATKDIMRQARLQLGHIAQDLQGEKAKGILKAIGESPKNWQNKVVQILETAAQREDDEEGGFSYNGLIMRDFKGYNDIEKFQELFNAFQNLDSQKMSLQDYSTQLFDNAFGTDATLKSNAAGMHYSILANKENPGIFDLIVYGAGSAPKNLSEKEYATLGSDFGIQSKENAKLNTIISLAKANGALTDLNRDTVAVAHAMLLNKDFLDLDAIISNSGNARQTDQRIKNLVKNLQVTTSVINPEQQFPGVQPLALRKTNAEALVLAVMAEKHLSNQFDVKRTKDGIKATHIKPDLPFNEEKDGEYYRLVKDSSRETIATANTLMDINQQIGRIKGGDAFKLGSKLGGISDFSSVVENIAEKLPEAVRSLLGQTDSEFKKFSEEVNTDDYFNTGDIPEDNANKRRLADVQKQYTENMSYLAAKMSETKDENLKKVYTLRMRAEGIKVRTAFKIASLVQGGGTGGGRTISNQDFEVIYNSLFKTPGTPGSFTAAMAQVRHEMLKQEIKAETYLKYGKFGYRAANDAVHLATAYLDAQMSEHYHSGKAYDSTNFIKEIPENLIVNVQKNELVGIFGDRTSVDSQSKKFVHMEADITALIDKENGLGIEKSKVDELFNAVDLAFTPDSEGGVKVTDTEKKTIAGLYAVSLLPALVADRKAKKLPITDDDLKEDLKAFQFGENFIGLMINTYNTKKSKTIDEVNEEEKILPEEKEIKKVNEIELDIIQDNRPFTGLPKPVVIKSYRGEKSLKRNNVKIGDLKSIAGQNRIREFLPERNRQIIRAFELGYANPQEYLDAIDKADTATDLLANKDSGKRFVQYPSYKEPPDDEEAISSAMFDYILQITKDLQ